MPCFSWLWTKTPTVQKRGPTSQSTHGIARWFLGPYLQVDDHGMIRDELLNETWDEQDDQGQKKWMKWTFIYTIHTWSQFFFMVKVRISWIFISQPNDQIKHVTNGLRQVRLWESVRCGEPQNSEVEWKLRRVGWPCYFLASLFEHAFHFFLKHFHPYDCWRWIK